MLEEPAGEVLHGVVVGRAHHVVVEAVVPLAAQEVVVDVVGVHPVERHAALLEDVLGRVGGRGGDHVHVAALDEPGHERAEPRARQRAREPERDQALPVDQALPGREGLPESPALEGRLAHAPEEPRHRPATGSVGDELERHPARPRDRMHAG